MKKPLIITEEEKKSILNLHSLSEQWTTKDIEDNVKKFFKDPEKNIKDYFGLNSTKKSAEDTKYVNIVDVLKLDGFRYEYTYLSPDFTNKLCSDCSIFLNKYVTDEYLEIAVVDNEDISDNVVLEGVWIFLKFKKDNNKILTSTFESLKKIANVKSYSDLKSLNLKFNPWIQTMLDAVQKTKKYSFYINLNIGLDSEGGEYKNNVFTANHIQTKINDYVYYLYPNYTALPQNNYNLPKYKYRIENGEIVFYPLKTETSTETKKEESSTSTGINKNLISSEDNDYVYVKSEFGDPWEYKFNKEKGMWETLNPTTKQWILIDPSKSENLKKANDAIVKRYGKL